MAPYVCSGCASEVNNGQVLVDLESMYTENPLVIHLRSGRTLLEEQGDPTSCIFRYIVAGKQDVLQANVMLFSEFENLVKKHAAQTQS